MSTTQPAIRKSLGIPVPNLVRISGGFDLVGSLVEVIGVKQTKTAALTGAAVETVQSSPVVTHKWAERVGMYNNDPIWDEIFQNVRDSRKRRRKG